MWRDGSREGSRGRKAPWVSLRFPTFAGGKEKQSFRATVLNSGSSGRLAQGAHRRSLEFSSSFGDESSARSPRLLRPRRSRALRREVPAVGRCGVVTRLSWATASRRGRARGTHGDLAGNSEQLKLAPAAATAAWDRGSNVRWGFGSEHVGSHEPTRTKRLGSLGSHRAGFKRSRPAVLTDRIRLQKSTSGTPPRFDAERHRGAGSSPVLGMESDGCAPSSESEGSWSEGGVGSLSAAAKPRRGGG